jgi:hypothetical protein
VKWRRRLASSGATVTATSLLALPVSVSAPNATDDPPAIPPGVLKETAKKLIADRELQLAAAKRRERRWRRLAGKRLRSIAVLRRSLRVEVRLGGASGLERAFLCIHGFEGSWRDPSAPYWGGLQMDWSFMATYGGPFLRAFGPANNWTPAMQLATAERAVLTGKSLHSGWPNTSRACGL